jgi:dTDP-4-dehydrorhamnose 3,5-epimerase
MTKTETNVDGVYVLDPVLHGDQRGFFMEVWNQKTFADLGINDTFVQDNHSRSVKGTLRGLHYQIQHPQGKLVRVIEGEVFDVAVDLRRQSPTFGKWFGALLTAENRRMMWVPPGMAHGFYVTSDTAEFVYKCTDFYQPDYERSLRWDDPDLAIEWPLHAGTQPLLSDKDRHAPLLKHADLFA